MRFSANPGVLSAGNQGKTYDDFVAHITALAAGGIRGWATNSATSADAYRTTAAAASGTMYGTSWVSYLFFQFAPCRLIQHGLPSATVFNDQVANGRQVFFRIVDATPQYVFSSLARNGYTSQFLDAGEPSPTVTCTEIIYWDGTQAWRMNPSSGTGPTSYDW